MVKANSFSSPVEALAHSDYGHDDWDDSDFSPLNSEQGSISPLIPTKHDIRKKKKPLKIRNTILTKHTDIRRIKEAFTISPSIPTKQDIRKKRKLSQSVH